MGSECVSDGAFAGARRSRNSHAVPSAKGRSNTSHNLWDLCTVPFDVRHELRQGPLVTSQHPLNEIHSGSVLHGGRRDVTLYMYAQERKIGRDQDRRGAYSRIYVTISAMEEPGPKTACTPFAWSSGISLSGMVPPPTTSTSSAPWALSNSTTRGKR
jgi:hypothetical protein